MSKLTRRMYWFRKGITFEDAVRIRDRKSIWLVEYLRGRRSNDTLTGFYRRKHFEHRPKSEEE